MSRDHRTHSARAPRGRRSSLPAGHVPDPPEASFWLDRTPLPTAPRPAHAEGGERPALTPPSTVCPKCDSPLSPSEAACPACGLRRAMFGRFRAGSHDRVPPALEELWREVESRWGDPELHERFLAQVSLCGAYAYAASRYRQAARARQSDAISKLQLERLSRMVHAVMAVSAVRPGDERGAGAYRGLVVLLVVLVGLGAVGGLYLMHRSGAATEERAEPVRPSIQVRRGRSANTDGRRAPAFGGLRPARPPAAPDAAGAAGAPGEGRADVGGQAEDERADEPRESGEGGNATPEAAPTEE